MMGGRRGPLMNYNECLLEGVALTDAVQVQLLVSIVFMAQDPNRGLDQVREFSVLKSRMAGLMLRHAGAGRTRRRTARSRR